MPIEPEKGERLMDIDDVDWSQIAEHIVKLSKAMESAMSSPLREKTVVLLLHNATKVPKKHIVSVLRALPQLKEMYLE